MADLTPERIAELRLIAEAATKGPYEVVGLDGYGGPYALRMPHRSGRTWYGVEGIKRREDAEYFVAMNRNTVLALLDEIERMQHEVMHLRDFLAESEGLASRLRQQYEELRAAVVDASEAPARAREWMRRHNITFTDLDDHWQKVGFSLYSDLVEISERAKAALEVCQDAAAD